MKARTKHDWFDSQSGAAASRCFMIDLVDCARGCHAVQVGKG